MNNEFSTIYELYNRTLKRKEGSSTFFQYYVDSELKKISYSDFHKKVVLFSNALHELGLKKGDRLGLVSENRLEWVITDLASVSTGIIDVPTFPNFTKKQQKYIFENCEAKGIVVSNKFQLDRLKTLKNDLEFLKFIIVLEDGFTDEEDNIYSFNDLLKKQAEYDYKELENKFHERASQIKKDDILTLIYTSGTTGSPKGVTLTNANLVSNASDVLKTGILVENEKFLSFLPMCHSYERCVIYCLIADGATITIAESLDTISKNINEVRPTLITAVPKLLETVRSRILNKIEKESTSKREMVLNALKFADEYLQKENPSVVEKIKFKTLNKLVFKKIREGLGGRLRYIISGGAALNEDVHRFFHSIGIKVLQGYGLTECSPVVSVTLPEQLEIGTVGKPLDSAEVKISKKGEILVKGDLIMKGYWHDEFATNSSIDNSGWLHSGDIGEFTKLGNLKITDRIKNVIVNSGGKNITPSPIEDMLRMSDYIEHIVIFGDNKDYLTALISPDFDALKETAEKNNIKYSNEIELAENQTIRSLVKNDIENYQSGFAKYERVRRFKILKTPFSIEGGELTPKMSLKRSIIYKKYADEFESMY